MDLTLVAILYTGLFALGLQATLNSGMAGPAGRRQRLPRYRRRILACHTVIVLCIVVNAYLLARGSGAPRPEVAGLLTFDVLAFGGLLVTWSCLRRDASQALVRWIGLGLGAYAFGVLATWTALAFACQSETGTRFLASMAAAWDTSTATVGFVALFHYALTPVLLAAAVTAHDAWPHTLDWRKDSVLQPLALTTMLMALAYALFTLGVLWG